MSTRPDVQPLLDAAFDYAVAEYGKRGFKFWKDLIGDQINLPHPDDRGKQIEIMPMWYKKHDERIIVRVALVGLSFFRSEPTKCFLVNPDGSIEV